MPHGVIPRSSTEQLPHEVHAHIGANDVGPVFAASSSAIDIHTIRT